MTHDHDDDCGEPSFQPREDAPVPFGMEDNLDMVGDQLIAATEPLPASEAGLALIAAGIELLPAGRCVTHYREALIEVRAEVDRLLAEIADA